MEQPDKILNDAIEQMERHLKKSDYSTSCNLPMSVMLTLATSIREAHDVQNALARRLNGEIVERSQCQLEITGRLAALERDMRAHREAMAALNAADRQSDDDQICGC